MIPSLASTQLQLRVVPHPCLLNQKKPGPCIVAVVSLVLLNRVWACCGLTIFWDLVFGNS